MYFFSAGFQSTGQPRPKSSHSMLLSRKRVSVIMLPLPARASSMEFESISNTACSQPSSPSEPKMTAGRLRTLSSPLSWEMLSFP